MSSDFKGAKVLVTGAAGFIGSSLVDELLKQGAVVTGVDFFVDYYPRAMKEKNLSSAKTNSSFSCVEADLATMDIDALVRGKDYIFHQAAQAGVRASWGEKFDTYTHHNILATQRLLESCVDSPTLKRIMYASSSSIYGDAESYPTHEKLLPRPKSPYGVTKLAAEHLMMLYTTEFGVPTTSLRYFTVFGPRQRPDMAFHRFIRAGLTKEPVPLYGTGAQIRDFTFISDIVAANLAAACSNNTIGEVYNLGGGTEASITEVLSIIEARIPQLVIDRHPAQKGDATKTCADTSKAKNAFGFAPKVSLVEGIEHEIAWLKKEIS
jgi:nucleoside-diphosphate-sugar epimerase